MDELRVVNLEQAPNFRDMGGFTTQDGRVMKTGLLFRSDELSRLTSQDAETLGKLNLRTICDLRTPGERKSKPARLPEQCDVRIVNVPIEYRQQNFDYWGFVRFMVRKNKNLTFDQFIVEYYRAIVFEHTAQVSKIISLISDPGNLPALIHCTAGKDRTGVLSALIQLLAGVPRKDVVEDYLLTNVYFEPRVRELVKSIRQTSLFLARPERIRQMFTVQHEYLDEILDDILRLYGTIEGYLNRACGIADGEIVRLRQLLTE